MGIRKYLPLPLVLVILLLSVACGSPAPGGQRQADLSVAEGRAGAGAVGAPAPLPAAQYPKGAPSLAASSVPSGDALPETRLVIRTINMTALVTNVVEAMNQASGLAVELGGFVVSSSLSGNSPKPLEGRGALPPPPGGIGDGRDTTGFITMRVPAARTDEALQRLRGMAVRVTNENSNAQDVTEEHVDIQARLKNLEAAEAQFLAIMQRAQTVEDILKVQRELTNIRGQIEQVKGRMQYLERTSSTSLISVQLMPVASQQPLVQPGWSALETAKDAVRALTRALQNLADVGIRLLVFSPIWLPVGVVAGLLIFWAWRRIARALAGRA
ncbi:MAG: DUF4349 domain-containing protein [Chloroflexi bacterium]|nr:DUF4349 domain-containing protein [Chloroflexota bacterium]